MQDVYCPWDVINYCYDLITTQRAQIKSYWINTSGKLDEACERAIKQIEEKDYTAFLRKYRYKSIIEYGIAFHDKECCVIAKKLS